MGLFDKLKKSVANLAPQAQPQPQYYAPEPEPEPEQPVFDLAGFHPDDEDSFFNAVLHMESEGQFGGTCSRLRWKARYATPSGGEIVTQSSDRSAILHSSSSE